MICSELSVNLFWSQTLKIVKNVFFFSLSKTWTDQRGQNQNGGTTIPTEPGIVLIGSSLGLNITVEQNGNLVNLSFGCISIFLSPKRFDIVRYS